MGCEISGLWIVVGGEAAISHIHHRKIDTLKKKTKRTKTLLPAVVFHQVM